MLTWEVTVTTVDTNPTQACRKRIIMHAFSVRQVPGVRPSGVGSSGDYRCPSYNPEGEEIHSINWMSRAPGPEHRKPPTSIANVQTLVRQADELLRDFFE